MSIKIMNLILYRQAHRELHLEHSSVKTPSRSLLHYLRLLIKGHELLPVAPYLPTLKIVRFVTRGFSFSFYPGSNLTSCGVSYLALSASPYIIPDTVFTQPSAHHWDVSTVSLTNAFYTGIKISQQTSLPSGWSIFLFPLLGPFTGVESLTPREVSNCSDIQAIFLC